MRVAGRSPQPELENLGVELVRGDLADPEIAARAVAGCGTVFHVAAKAVVLGPCREAVRTPLGRRATLNLLRAAAAAGVNRFGPHEHAERRLQPSVALPAPTNRCPMSSRPGNAPAAAYR